MRPGCMAMKTSEIFPPWPEEAIKELLKIAHVPDTPDARLALEGALNNADEGREHIDARIPRKVFDRAAAAARELQAALRDLRRHGVYHPCASLRSDDVFATGD